MTAVKPRDLPDFLQSRGKLSFTFEEAVELTKNGRVGVVEALKKLKQSGKIFSPTSGFYVVIPAEYRNWGAVPAINFIDSWMKNLEVTYYVALLSAAELHGASHQKPQVFQVMSEKSFPNKKFNRVMVNFYKKTELIKMPLIKRNTPTGSVSVANVPMTILDLIQKHQHAGGLNNVATVILDLFDAKKLDVKDLIELKDFYSTSIFQRAGWLLELVNQDIDTSPLKEIIPLKHIERSNSLLDSTGIKQGKRNNTWGLVINNTVEPDR